MKALWKRIRDWLGLGAVGAYRQGCVEWVGPQEVSGWVTWSGDVPPKLQFACGVVRFPVDTVWHERQDIAAMFPQASPRSGFFFPLPADVRRLLSRKLPSGKRIIVLADGVPVRLAGTHVVNVPLLHAHDSIGRRERARSEMLFSAEEVLLDGCVVSVSLASLSSLRLAVTIAGKPVAGKPLPVPGVELVCGGQRLCAAYSSWLSGGRRELVFEVPGYWWSLASAAQGIPLQVMFGGQCLPAAPVALNPAWGRKCLQQFFRNAPGSTHDQLLALEHAHFLQSLGPLDTAVVAWLQSVANTYRLGDYLSGESPNDARTDQREQARQQLADALREVSRLLPEWQGREDDLVSFIERTLPTERQRESLRETMLPWFCRAGRGNEAAALFSPAHGKRLSRATNAWQLSLALPLLVAGRETGKATDAVRALTGMDGWVSTECLRDASGQVLATTDDPAGTERFGAALLLLLEKWAGDYWSRKEDAELIACCVSWLAACPRFTYRFRNDLFLTALRTFGLSPVFWQQLLPVLDCSDPLHARLHAAGQRFLRLQREIRDIPCGRPMTSVLCDDLAYFRRAGCRDVPRFVRELATAEAVAMSGVAQGGGGVRTAPAPLLDDLLSLGEPEILRMAAWPAESRIFAATESVALPGRALDLQRSVPRSAHAALQKQLAARLTTLASASDVEVGKFLADVETIRGEASCHLSVDILAAAWRASIGSESASWLADSLARHLDAIAFTAQAGLPAQPLFAATARLGREPGLSRFGGLDAAVRKLGVSLVQQEPAVAGGQQALSAGGRNTHIDDDVLVVVYSCRKYLDSRISVIRSTWLQDIQARGIPYVIVVGDGDGTLNGDVLQLAAPDCYEGLPAKTLALARWALANTRCQYLVKIDDDCLLNVPAFFDDLVYRQFHYYGRILRRGKGGMDRRWHQQKSQGDHARHALDKSPEPSSYADGGCGYSLSRHAMRSMLSAAETPAGLRLVSSSYMEDKVVGDLLMLAGIAGRGDEYHTLVRRKYGADAEPVNVYENTFFPSPAYPAKLAHLDSPSHIRAVWKLAREPGLWPKKLWPSYGLPSVEYGRSNQLELLTSLAQAQSLTDHALFVVSVMRNEKVMLPHFLRHYRSLGVRAFIIIDNLSDDGTREMLLAEPDVVVYSADTEYRHSQFGVVWQQTVLAAHCLNKWALVADADELLVCPDGMDLPSYTAKLAAGGHDAARVLMVDMYPAGDLAAADFGKADPFLVAPWFDAQAVVPWRLGSGSYSNAGNYVSGLRHRLMRTAEPHAFTAQKYALVRYAPWMRFSGGLHNVANAEVARETAWFAHFKYHSGFNARVDQEVARQQHFGLAQEYRRYQSLLANGGGFDLQGVSTKYSSPADFMRIIVADDAHRR